MFYLTSRYDLHPCCVPDSVCSITNTRQVSGCWVWDSVLENDRSSSSSSSRCSRESGFFPFLCWGVLTELSRAPQVLRLLHSSFGALTEIGRPSSLCSCLLSSTGLLVGWNFNRVVGVWANRPAPEVSCCVHFVCRPDRL